jgi:hypothetical protein
VALAAVCAVLSLGKATAAESPATYAVLGPGTISCATWAQQRRDDGYPAVAAGDWVLGYATAFNEYVAAGGEATRGTDSAALFVWIDNYCRANPLDSLAMASRHLVDVLKGRQP